MNLEQSSCHDNIPELGWYWANAMCIRDFVILMGHPPNWPHNHRPTHTPTSNNRGGMDSLHRLLWVKLMGMFSMYVQSRTHRHFHWRIIVVLTQNPTVLMYVDITGAPKLQQKYVETWVLVQFQSSGHREKYLGFMLFWILCLLYSNSKWHWVSWTQDCTQHDTDQERD